MTLRRAAAAMLAAALVSGCSASHVAARGGAINVFAAASLREAFDEIAAAFEAATGDSVRLSYGASDGLAAQIRDGAPADVFAAAGPDEMDAVAAARGVTDRAVFARNRLAVIVPARNAARMRTLADLARPGVKLVVAAPTVPAGRYARAMLRNAGLLATAARNVVSNEDSVKGVVQKIVLDEADAGIVYRTDVTGTVASAVRTIAIPDAINVIASYPVAVLRDSARAAIARRFVAYLRGIGRDVLERHGFLAP